MENNKQPNKINIVLIGDSIAYGTGDEKGWGFATYLPDYLKKQTSKDVFIDNIGINGLRSAELLEQLQDRELNSLLKASELVLVSIGGNDLRSLRSQNETTLVAEFTNLKEKYLFNLREIMGNIRKISPDIFIVFVGVYNPYEEKAGSDDSKLLASWNYDTQKIVDADTKALFIPTYDMFKFQLNSLLDPDGLHPNSQGYQAISNRIVKALENLF